MAQKLDQIVVIDVESTCWEGLRPPPGQISKIIEIGICTVESARLRRLERTSILVRPERSTISPFCTDLTTLTPDMFHDAVTLAAAAEILRTDYCTEQRVFASWGDYDRNQFLSNCRGYGIPYPFGPTHLNVKSLFSLSFGLQRELGINDALDHVGLTMEGTHHRGVDDAWNIAKLLCLLLKRMRQGVVGLAR